MKHNFSLLKRIIETQRSAAPCSVTLESATFEYSKVVPSPPPPPPTTTYNQHQCNSGFFGFHTFGACALAATATTVTCRCGILYEEGQKRNPTELCATHNQKPRKSYEARKKSFSFALKFISKCAQGNGIENRKKVSKAGKSSFLLRAAFRKVIIMLYKFGMKSWKKHFIDVS